MDITVAQQKAHQFICRFIKKHHYAPTTAEIAEGLGIKSRGAVHRYVKALVAAGLLELASGRHRNIRLAKTEKLLPLEGVLDANHITALPLSETEDISKQIIRENCYALRVDGNCLEMEGILDGDILILERRQKPENNDIVLAHSETHGLLLRRIQHNADKSVTLFPICSRMLPKICQLKELEIAGILTHVTRSFV